MTAAPSFPIANRRVQALHSYAVLDTPPEEALDDLAALAAQICGAPIALIALIDENRQWFKARFGLEMTETPLELSFCTHALDQPGLLIVPDATQDPRFAQNPLVSGEGGIRFYAGAPLRTPEGETLGTLCVIDRVPRTLTAAQEQALAVLSRQVMSHLEMRRQARILAENERLLRGIFNAEPECVKLLNAGGDLQMMNRAGLSMIEADSFEQVAGHCVLPLIAAEYREDFEALSERVFRGESGTLEFQIVGLKGTGRWLETHAAPLRDETGAVTALLGITRDTTARHEAERALRASEASMAAAQRIAHLGSWELELLNPDDLDANPLHWSAEMFRIAGYEPGSVPVSNELFFHLVPPAEHEAIRQAIATALRGNGHYSMVHRLIRPDGQERVVRESAQIFFDQKTGQPLRIIGTTHDITEQRESAAALQKSDRELRGVAGQLKEERAHLVAAQAVAKVGSWDTDLSTQVVSWSAETYRIFEQDPAAFQPTHSGFLQLVHPDDREAVDRAFTQSLEERGACAIEHRLRMPDGRIKFIEEHWQISRDEQGNPTRALGTCRDITERKHSEIRFRRLVDSNAQGVLFWKADGEIIGANDAFLDLVGYSRQDLEAGAMNWVAMTPPEYADLDRHCITEIAARGVCPPYEKAYLRKNGSPVPVLIGAASLDDGSGEGVAFTVDLTERKKLDQQYLRAQRMESIGTLAGGIAHDLNNCLGPIILSLDLLKLKFGDPASRDFLAIIESSAQRGADMVRQVLSFARGVEGRRVEVQIEPLVREIEKIANDTFLKQIRVHTVIPDGLWKVMGDPTQIHQVLLNLCVNARDAMPHGGALTISAENLVLDAHYAGLSWNREAKPGAYVCLQMTDSGTGIAPDIIEKIFDPFFTTKEAGRGTGLGLSTTLAIVKSHGGFIRTYSELGKGTKFATYLPAQPGTDAVEAAEAATELLRGNGELILVVDDELAVRQITDHTLKAFGYRVVLAANGAEAIAIFAQEHQQIAAVLTDMTMPVMDGPTAIRILRRLNPNVPIIAASGLPADDRLTPLGVQYFLPKPYRAEALLKVLRETLSGNF